MKSCSWCSVGHLGIKYIHSHKFGNQMYFVLVEQTPSEIRVLIRVQYTQPRMLKSIVWYQERRRICCCWLPICILQPIYPSFILEKDEKELEKYLNIVLCLWNMKTNWKIEKSATYHPSSSIIVERTKSCRSSPDPTPAHLAENIHVFQKRAHFNNQNLEIFSFYILQTHVHRLQESSYSMAQAITKNVIQVWVSLF